MPKSYWLVKQEPTAYSFAQLQKDKKTAWTGVRNHQARNNLTAMGGRVLGATSRVAAADLRSIS